MKYFTLILFLIFIGCKNESKVKTESPVETTTESESESKNGIDKSVYEMRNNYIEKYPEFEKDELPDSHPFHNNEYDAKRLADLIVSGKKKAGSNLYFWYKEANADLPKIGTKSIVTDFDGKARTIIEIKKVDTIPFNQISEDYAKLDMGTDIEPLKKWKKAHWEFFQSALKQSGEKPTEEMLIVCEWFETIWPKKH